MSSLIALTGATGFIGQFLLSELPRRGYRIRVLLRRPSDMQVQGSSAVIGDLSRPQNMGAALRDVDAVVHSAGLSGEMTGIPEDDYRSLNTDATVNLANAARKAGVKRFVFLSSIRAQCGPWAPEVLTEATEPRPTDAYGRSKLAAEQALAELDIDWVALRLVLVYGPGVKGNFALLLRAARTRAPLPVKDFINRRSLISIDNFISALDFVLATPATLGETYVVADPGIPPRLGDLIATMRKAQGRRPLLLPLPPHYLETPLRLMLRDGTWERLGGNLRIDAGKLIAAGWQPLHDTRGGLMAMIETLKHQTR